MNKKWISASAIIFALAGGFYLLGNNLAVSSEVEEEIVLEEEEFEENLLYGINIDELDVIEGIVGKNQTLSTILAPFNVPYQIIDEIARKSKEVFDVRRIAFN